MEKYRTMKIYCTPVSESRFPNSEFHMGYGRSGIPHHEVSDRGDDPETDFGMIGHGVTGWDMGCLTLVFYVNSLAKGDDRRKEWPTGKNKGRMVSNTAPKTRSTHGGRALKG